MTVHNFSAGPTCLPAIVVARIKEELGNWHGQGISAFEISHRSTQFMDCYQHMYDAFRQLTQLPDSHEIVFMSGGAQVHFGIIPLNLGLVDTPSAYWVSGYWSNRAAAHGKAMAAALPPIIQQQYTNETARNIDWDNYGMSNELTSGKYSYVHYCPNETINGIRVGKPQTASPLIADYSSAILSEPFNYGAHGMVYACMQKNLGPAGLSVAMIDRNLLARTPAPHCPIALQYQAQVQQKSMLNTPNTFAMYVTGLVLDWLKSQGGIAGIHAVNQKKAGKLYAMIDNSTLYENIIPTQFRSLMNIPFTCTDELLHQQFLQQATGHDMLGLKGHLSVGGLRASLYNPVSEASVDALIGFMQEFERRA